MPGRISQCRLIRCEVAFSRQRHIFSADAAARYVAVCTIAFANVGVGRRLDHSDAAKNAGVASLAT
jgi:hypothetical protein